jgi:hypothetical protein
MQFGRKLLGIDYRQSWQVQQALMVMALERGKEIQGKRNHLQMDYFVYSAGPSWSCELVQLHNSERRLNHKC